MTSVARTDSVKSAAVWPVASIGVVALGVRLWALDRFSFWLDEILEVFTIRAPWGRMLRNLHDQLLNPPLDYILQKSFDAFGPSDSVRRILPALWGAGFVVVMGLLVRRRAAPRVGLMTSICLAFAPLHVHYSQEVRPYSLGLFLTALSLLLIDRYLERPGTARLIAVLLSAVAVAYALLVAAIVLFLAGGSLILDDALTAATEPRRASARRLLRWSPALLLIIGLLYLPWLSPVWKAMALPPFSTLPTFGFHRVVRFFSVFGFGFHDGYPLGRPGVLFAALSVLGAALAWAMYRLRFLVVWAVGGLAILEILEERHGVYDSIFHFLPAGIALTALATLPIGWLAQRRRGAWAAGAALVIVLFLDARALAFYFRQGRPDWRPVAAYLRGQTATAPIFAAGQYTRLCLGYYVNGPDWLCCSPPKARAIIDVGADAAGLEKAWTSSGTASLVVPVGAKVATPESLDDAEATLFPTADRGVWVRPLVRREATGRLREPESDGH